MYYIYLEKNISRNFMEMHHLITSFCMLLTKLKSMKIVLPKTCNVMPLMYTGGHFIYDVTIVM